MAIRIVDLFGNDRELDFADANCSTLILEKHTIPYCDQCGAVVIQPMVHQTACQQRIAPVTNDSMHDKRIQDDINYGSGFNENL